MWYDKWLHEGRLCDILPFIHIEDTLLQVKDVYFDGKWHLEGLATVLPRDIMDKIKVVPIADDSSLEDIVIWSHVSSGEYSTKSGYVWLLAQPGHSCVNGLWNWIWSLKAPEKFKFLIWLIFHDALPTNAMRVTRHLAHDASCPWCACPVEDVNHCLRECAITVDIWKWIGLWQPNNFFSLELKRWIKVNSKGPNSTSFLSTL